MSDNDNPIKYVDLGEEYLLRSLSLAELKNTLNELRVEESNTFNNDKHGSHWLLLQHSIKAFKAEIASRDSNHKTIVHSEMLDPFTRLEIRLHDVPEAEKYTFSIVFVDEVGESYGHASNGEWYETQSACHADAYIQFITQHKHED